MVHKLPELSWPEREAVNLKVGSSSLPGSVCARSVAGLRAVMVAAPWISLRRDMAPNPLADEYKEILLLSSTLLSLTDGSGNTPLKQRDCTSVDAPPDSADILYLYLYYCHRSHFGSRYKLGCCIHAGLFPTFERLAQLGS